MAFEIHKKCVWEKRKQISLADVARVAPQTNSFVQASLPFFLASTIWQEWTRSGLAKASGQLVAPSLASGGAQKRIFFFFFSLPF